MTPSDLGKMQTRLPLPSQRSMPIFSALCSEIWSRERTRPSVNGAIWLRAWYSNTSGACRSKLAWWIGSSASSCPCRRQFSLNDEAQGSRALSGLGNHPGHPEFGAELLVQTDHGRTRQSPAAGHSPPCSPVDQDRGVPPPPSPVAGAADRPRSPPGASVPARRTETEIQRMVSWPQGTNGKETPRGGRWSTKRPGNPLNPRVTQRSALRSPYATDLVMLLNASELKRRLSYRSVS